MRAGLVVVQSGTIKGSHGALQTWAVSVNKNKYECICIDNGCSVYIYIYIYMYANSLGTVV